MTGPKRLGGFIESVVAVRQEGGVRILLILVGNNIEREESYLPPSRPPGPDEGL